MREIRPKLIVVKRFYWKCPNCERETEVIKELCGEPRQDIYCICGAAVEARWIKPSSNPYLGDMGHYEFYYYGPEDQKLWNLAKIPNPIKKEIEDAKSKKV